MRVGLLGAGRIGGIHGATLSAHPDVERLVIADADPSAATALAASLGASWVPTIDELLASELDAVVIAAATAAHAELIYAAADAGLSIFCEKPIALDLEETYAVVQHVSRRGVALQVGFHRRFDQGFVAVRRRLVTGELGRLYSIRIVAADAEPPPPGYLTSSGGIFRDMHIHDFDLARWLTCTEVRTVYATGSSLGLEQFEAVADLASVVVVLTMCDGAFVTISGCRDNAGGYDVRAEIAASRGTVSVGLDRRTPLGFDKDRRPWPMEQPYTGFLDRFSLAYRAELSSFLDFVGARIENPCTGDDALQAFRIAIAAEISHRERRPVDLAEVA